MATHYISSSSSSSYYTTLFLSNKNKYQFQSSYLSFNYPKAQHFIIHCSKDPVVKKITLRTCKICKSQFDPLLNHHNSCTYHTSHFGGETKRKFESVHSGGTMNTPNSGKVLQYWHCCGSEDPFDIGCTAAPHSSYDD